MNDVAESANSSTNSSSSLFKTLLMILLPLLIGGGLVYGVAKQKPEFLGLPQDSAQVQSDIDSLVTEVGKLIVLPADERPTVATISDVEKVKDQPFFKNAQNGDKVLIYTNARKAILYRESEKKVIEVGAVNINQATPSASASPQPTATPRITPVPTAE